ncbi:Core-2/I-Branching enzyme [compost metagenome]
MRVAHLILTYTSPHQTERMIRNMAHDGFDFYIHVDKKFDINPHLFLKDLPNVYFINDRTDVKWAGYNTVKATFRCIKEIVATGIQYDFINFLSGQDYPLTSPARLMDFFEKNKGKEFMSFRDIKNDWKEGLIRMERYFLANHTFKGKHALEKLINILMPKRTVPYDMHPYGKSMFWMLSPETAMYVVDKVESDRKLTNFFYYCWASDEFVFQTILMNSPYRDKIINNNYRYIDWSLGGASPKLLDEHDFEQIKASDMLFARKLNIEKSAKLFDLIDTELLMLFSIITWHI